VSGYVTPQKGPRCKLCGGPIETPKEAWREMTGWVSPKAGKAMTGATATGQLAHPTCIVALRHQVHVAQESLL
jgi:hypothetical protein